MKTTILLFAAASLFAQNREAGRVVGKPYSATQINHSEQTLGNGAHINQTSTDRIFRDEQGRTRIEIDRGRIQSVEIMDIVAKFAYVLDPEQKTARKTEMHLSAAMQQIAGDVSPVDEARRVGRGDAKQVVEDLGSRVINGVTALGVRVTYTTPVGAIGNDQELKSITERWYSNELHAMVKTISDDPRFGHRTFELTNIVRAVPDPALFQLPAGYTITNLVTLPHEAQPKQ